MSRRHLPCVLLAFLGLGPVLPLGAAEVPYEGHTGAVRCLAFAPDGRHALSGGEDKVVRYFDTRTLARDLPMAHASRATLTARSGLEPAHANADPAEAVARNNFLLRVI
jgi:WD40 repeat protein